MEQLPGSQIIGTFKFQVYTHCQFLIHRRKCYIQLVNRYLMLSTVTTCSIYRIISKTTILNQYTRITWEKNTVNPPVSGLDMRHVHPVGLILVGMGHASGFLELHDENILPQRVCEKKTLSHNQSQAVHLYNWRLGGVKLAFSCERITC